MRSYCASQVIAYLPAFEATMWTISAGVDRITTKIIVQQSRYQTRLTKRGRRQQVRLMRHVKSIVLDDRIEVDERTTTLSEHRQPAFFTICQRNLLSTSPLIGKHETASLVIADRAIRVMQMERQIAASDSIHQVDVVLVKLDAHVIGAIERTRGHRCFRCRREDTRHRFAHVTR